MEHPQSARDDAPDFTGREADRPTFARAWEAEVAEGAALHGERDPYSSPAIAPDLEATANEVLAGVYRLQTDRGERIVGRKVSPAWVAARLKPAPRTYRPTMLSPH